MFFVIVLCVCVFVVFPTPTFYHPALLWQMCPIVYGRVTDFPFSPFPKLTLTMRLGTKRDVSLSSCLFT